MIILCLIYLQPLFIIGLTRISPNREKKSEIVQNKRTNRSISLSLSPSPDRTYNRQPLNETKAAIKDRNQDRKVRDRPKVENTEPKKDLDPILEARRRKFENPIPVGTSNGIIKLNINKKENKDKSIGIEEKIEEESSEPIEENISVEEEIDDLLDLNPSIDDLWSEEESDNENEGRFKTQNTQKRTVTYLQFSKLTEKQIKKSVLTTNNERNQKRECKRGRDRPRKETKIEKREIEKPDRKSRVRTDEIKVKSIEKEKFKEEKKEEKKEPVKEVRKVEIPKKIEEPIDDLDDDPEIIIEFDDDDEIEEEKHEKDEKDEQKTKSDSKLNYFQVL